MNSLSKIDIDLINKFVIQSMINRGYILFDNSPSCPKFDKHFYFENNPVTLELENTGLISIKVKIKVYHKSHDIFIAYAYKATITRYGIKERDSFSKEYTYILMVIKSILHERKIFNYLKQRIST